MDLRRRAPAGAVVAHDTAVARLRAWKWAHNIVLSRALAAVFNSTEHGCHLVPAIEMMNHANERYGFG